MIFRNDDISIHTDAWHFKRVNDLFKKYNKRHLVAVLFEDIFHNYEITDLLVNEDNIDIGWHGWTWKHLKYGEMLYEDIYNDMKTSIDYWNASVKRRYGKEKRIIKSLPTWHCVNDNYKRASEACGLIFAPEKSESEGVFTFHSWAYIRDQKLEELEKILRKY